MKSFLNDTFKDWNKSPKGIIRIISFWVLLVLSILYILISLANTIYPIFTGEWYVLSVRENAIMILSFIIYGSAGLSFCLTQPD